MSSLSGIYSAPLLGVA